MKRINCIAVDDEPLALTIIENFCARIPELKLQCFNSPILALEHLQSQQVDLLFLDINMPEMMGLEIAAQINTLPYIIFTTAYPEYAVESYEFNTVGYLLKPYNFERFNKAVQKALSLLNELSRKETISLKLDYRNIIIELDSILYIEAMGNYAKIHTRKQSYLPQMTMKQLEEQLGNTSFQRIHRSYIVNMSAIDSYKRNEVSIAGTQLPIGKSFINKFKP